MNLVRTAPLAAIARIHGPHIAWAALSPIIVLAAGALVVLVFGLLRGAMARQRGVPMLTLLALAGALGTEIWRFHHAQTIIAGALRIDDLGLIIDMVCAVAAIACVLLSWRSPAPRSAGQGEYFGLLLFSVMGMAVLSSSQDIITLFLGLELLSIPLYILCAAEHRREGSLESGLKYLIIGSVGSATLLYGLALVYGATGQTTFSGIAARIASHGVSLTDPLLLTAIALIAVGFAFKASVAPFHQWTPDVYEGAPTPITAFMATATKAAALAVFLRMFDVALVADRGKWAPLIAAIAAVTIIVGNAGALGQRSVKRMLGYSGVAQAGYMLSGLVVGTRLGISATVLYIVFYLGMNIAAFAAITAVERARGDDSLDALAGLGRSAPLVALPLSIAMLALGGVPGTVGFIGKFQLIHALVNGNYTWLAIVLVVGAMISLGYYLRVVGSMWIGSRRTATDDADGGTRAPRPEAGPAGFGSGSGVPLPAGFAPMAGGSPEADEPAGGEGGGDEGDGDDRDNGDAHDASDASSGDADPADARAFAEPNEQLNAGDGPVPETGPPTPEAGEELTDDESADTTAADAMPRLSLGKSKHRSEGLAPAYEPEPESDQLDPVDVDPEVGVVAVVFAGACIFFGIIPGPAFHFAAHAGAALPGLF